jgi:two-component system, NtrC family, nitrogen regulation response regulator NtrX
MAKILVVDDERAIRSSLKDILELEKYQVQEAGDGFDCLARAKSNKFDVIILDIKMPKMDGIEALMKLQDICPEVPVIMISGHGDIDTAVDAVRKGAFDFIQKPLDMRRLQITVRNALDKSNLVFETKKLKIRGGFKAANIVGESEEVRKLKDQIALVAKRKSRVLIIGPNGTGKELVARSLHEKSDRKDKTFIEVNCAAIPGELIESELFGHIKGAFTGAVKDHAGKFEQANEGTLFLDEIGDMSLQAQAKMLRALQEGKVSRVGGDKDITVDVRVIAATNKDLLKEIEAGRFRSDLYYRLEVVNIRVPALADRRTDIPLLIEHFLDLSAMEYNEPKKAISQDAINSLIGLPWHGNIRELKNNIERLVIYADEEISVEDVRTHVMPYQQNINSANRWSELFEQFEDITSLQTYIKAEYAKYKGVLFG